MSIYEYNLSEKQENRLNDFKKYLSKEQKSFVGYPCNILFDYSELYPFLQFGINNVGDPYESSNYHIHTREFELEVLDFFGKITHMPEKEQWGYVTNGGSEGNLYGVFLARETLPDALVYYSEDTHYSVGKAMRLLGVRSIMIRRQDNGEMDYDDLRETVNIHRDHPAIVFTTIGTTMTGAIDNIPLIEKILKDLLIDRYYIHADAALSGMILPFVNDPPPWDFRSGIDSISISGHKFIGSPIPCGVVLAKKSNMEKIARAVEYVGALDTTLLGSRNGITPLFLWYAIKRHGVEGFTNLVKGCLEMADYTIGQFNNNGIASFRNNNANTVIFPKPPKEVLDKWQIAVHEKIAHVITMPHIKKDTIDKLMKDIGKYKDNFESTNLPYNIHNINN